MNWLPDRKVIGGGLVGIATWLIVLAAQHFGIAIPADVQAQIAGLLGLATAYLIPAADQDIVKKLNDRLVAIAQADPNVPVTPPKV